jgi:hypothetical protein
VFGDLRTSTTYRTYPTTGHSEGHR